jgi:hypothetical protein
LITCHQRIDQSLRGTALFKDSKHINLINVKTLPKDSLDLIPDTTAKGLKEVMRRTGLADLGCQWQLSVGN